MKLTDKNIKIQDGLVKPTSLLKVAVFNDIFRTDICWLEFWVWVCSDGVKPKEEEYMSEVAIGNIINNNNIY